MLILLIVGGVATRAMWGPALLAGHSAWFDLARMVEFDAALRHGEFLPSWSPDFYFGYGSPLFQFYAPLSYYLAEIPVLAGCDLPTALKCTQFLALVLSGLAFYRLAVTYFSGWAACLGAVFYMIAPYRLVDMYVRHALAEHCAFIWLPLIVWGIERFLTRRNRVGLLTGTLATAALILTHNIMALIGLPVCVLAGWAISAPAAGDATPVARWPGRLAAALQSLGIAVIPAVLGVGLAAFFWLPAMSGRPLTQAEESLTGGYFDFHRHFVSWVRFISPEWGFGESGNEIKDRMSLQIGLPHLLVWLGALTLLFVPQFGTARRWGRCWCATGVFLMAAAVFFCSSWSQPLWEHLPLVRYAQFPWRFLGLVVFGAALCGAAVADRLGSLGGGARTPLLVFLLGSAVVLTTYYPYYSRGRFIAADRATRRLESMTSERIAALARWDRLIPLGRSLARADIRAAGERATSKDDFLPRGVLPKPTHPAAAVLISPGNQIGPVTQAGLNDYRAEVAMHTAGPVQLAQFWFPGWEADIDGRAAETHAAGPQAVVTCDLPAGQHTIEFRYTALPQRRVGWGITLAALFLTAGSAVFAARNFRLVGPSADNPRQITAQA